MRPLVTLTTDFGYTSSYVAQMKGVILSICREVDLIDLSHGVGPQSIREGALLLADATPRFPGGTIHVAVVDPGVGLKRRLVYCELGGQRYLAPDNGLLSLLVAKVRPHRMIAIENQEWWLRGLSSTFHGRDILAPVAAHLARGIDPGQLGPAVEELLSFTWPEPSGTDSGFAGEVLVVDSFGNLITNITRDHLPQNADLSQATITCAGHELTGIERTYGSRQPGALVALFDSQGRLEIAQVCGSAARTMDARLGCPVAIYWRPGKGAG